MLRHSLTSAILSYKAGKFTEAEKICQQIVSAKKDFFHALHLLAVVQASLGKNDLALVNYDRALSVRPDYAEALYNRGIALQELKRHDEALASYDRALSVRPEYAEALYNRGNALKELKRYGEALASYDRALSLRPDYADALNNRGIALKEMKQLDEALASYGRALALRPDHAESLNNRGNVLQEMKRLDEALASYGRALSVRPDYAEASNNMGAALIELGRLDEARDYFEKAIRLSPKTPKFYFALTACKQLTADDPHLMAMQKLAQNMRSSSAEQQISLCFALSKALADVKQYEQSFDLLLHGNALKRQQIAYDEAGELELFQRTQMKFTAELMRSKQGVGNPSNVPIFILGMPRSGSTLVEQILASHPKVFGAGELNDFDTAITRLLGGSPVPFPEGITALSGDQLHRLGTNYLDATTALAPEAARITDKMPANFRFVGLIHIALPHARIIHTRRDPVDTCLSCFSTLFAAGQSFSYDLGELGRYYRAYDALMQHWRNVLPNGVMLEVQYEEVVVDLEGQTRRLLAHCGLDWDDACLAFHRTKRPVRTATATQVRHPIYRSSIGRWRPPNDLLRPLLEGLKVGRRP